MFLSLADGNLTPHSLTELAITEGEGRSTPINLSRCRALPHPLALGKQAFSARPFPTIQVLCVALIAVPSIQSALVDVGSWYRGLVILGSFLHWGFPLAKFARTHQFYPALLVGHRLPIFAMIRSAVAIASAMADSSAGEDRPSQFTSLRAAKIDAEISNTRLRTSSTLSTGEWNLTQRLQSISFAFFRLPKPPEKAPRGFRWVGWHRGGWGGADYSLLAPVAELCHSNNKIPTKNHTI